jgi:P-aminobenzoate N-oxygenase AurF
MTAYRAVVEKWKEDYKRNVQVEEPSAFTPNLRYFSVAQTKLFCHPKVQNAPRETQNRLLILQLYNFLEFFVWAEQGPVTEVCEQMSAKDYFLRLPRDLAEGARTVRRQEANHSQWAFKLLLSVENATGMTPLDAPLTFLQIMDKMIEREKELEKVIKLFFVIIAELLDLGTAEAVRQDETVQQPVRAFADAHENEEKLHRVYFRKLFEDVWIVLPSDIQQQIGVLMPEIFIAFLGPNQRMMRRMLEIFPDDFPNIDAIVTELTQPEEVTKGIREEALEVLNFMGSVSPN